MTSFYYILYLYLLVIVVSRSLSGLTTFFN
jgi:hypothetical protein